MPPEGLSRPAYFEAAFAILAEQGSDGLTIAALCNRLGVTKGSFYHHFRDFSAFVHVLLAHWADEHATRLIALSESARDVEERYRMLQAIAVGLPHGAEAAIRAWSWSNQRVAQVQREVDAARLAHLTSAGEQAGMAPDRAQLMAKISLSALIGMQQLDRPAHPGAMEEVFSELRKVTLSFSSSASP